MKLNRTIVDTYLRGEDVSNAWIFSSIQSGQRLFDDSDIAQKQTEIKNMADLVSAEVSRFNPCNEKIYRRLFTGFAEELADYEVFLTVGVPAPYDAMVQEKDGRDVMIFDMGRFLAYPNAMDFVRRMITHETAHAMLHRRWPKSADASYAEQLRYMAFDEGFAHLLACGKEIETFNFTPWLEQYETPAAQQLRTALACTDTNQQQELLLRANTGSYWNKFAAIAGKLYLARHRGRLEEIYQAGPGQFMPRIFEPLERN